MAINKSRKVPLARREFRVEMQQRDGDSGSADDRPMCPIQYGSQRAAHAHTILSILRVFRSTYYPQHRLSDVIENMYVALPVFIAHVAGRPATASQIARTLEMPRPHTVLSRIEYDVPDADGIHPLSIAPISPSVRSERATMDARIKSMEGAGMPQAAFLKCRFDLTPAEARIVLRLVAGDSLRCAANALGITYETVRTHLKAVFQKTGTCRQAELVIVVMRAMDEVR